jgi:hypothetical protein
MDKRHPLRRAVRRELALDCGKSSCEEPRRSRRGLATLLRVTAVATLLWGLGGAASFSTPDRVLNVQFSPGTATSAVNLAAGQRIPPAKN